MLSPEEALQRLREGNRRFAAGLARTGSLTSPMRRRTLISGQEPFAAVLGCSDSRVPVEIVFEQGLGDLFVIRVAGNVVAPHQLGSVELAVEVLGTRLVVVLGHTDCGAVQATLEALERPGEETSPNLRSIVDRVRPSVEPLLATEAADDPEELMRRAVRANVRAAVEHLRDESETLRRRLESEELRIVGAEYSLDTGVVDFFDQKPRTVPHSPR